MFVYSACFLQFSFGGVLKSRGHRQVRRNANGDIGGDIPNVVAAAKYCTAQHSNCWWHHYGSAICYTRSLALDASMVLRSKRRLC